MHPVVFTMATVKIAEGEAASRSLIKVGATIVLTVGTLPVLSWVVTLVSKPVVFSNG